MAKRSTRGATDLQKIAATMEIERYTNEEIARRVGVCVRTIRRWRHEPRYYAEIEAIRESIIERSKLLIF